MERMVVMTQKKVARGSSLPKMRRLERPWGKHNAYVTLSGVRDYLGEYGAGRRHPPRVQALQLVHKHRVQHRTGDAAVTQAQRLFRGADTSTPLPPHSGERGVGRRIARNRGSYSFSGVLTRHFNNMSSKIPFKIRLCLSKRKKSNKA